MANCNWNKSNKGFRRGRADRNMKKIAIVTATRAEYGLLYPVIKELRKYESQDLLIELIATGTHLVKEYGETIRDIEADGIRVDKKIYVSVKSDNRRDIANN